MNIVIGMCGGIACYKVCSVVGALKKFNHKLSLIIYSNFLFFMIQKLFKRIFLKFNIRI